jgi:FAD:protein FMN transferase
MGDHCCVSRRAQLWLGTLVEVTAEASSDEAADAGVASAFAAIARVHRALTLHDPQSELARVNRHAPGGVQSLSADLRAVLGCALELAARSRGAFDPTVGAHVAAFGFVPPQGQADHHATWRDVLLTRKGVRFAKPLVLDLGGIAKGYAVDCAIDALRGRGIIAGRVNAGGDLRVFGNRSEPVHVRTGGPQRVVLPLVEITDAAVATSAYGGQRRRVDGRWATPLIDPFNRLPRMSTRTVSVVASTCMVADALTKVVALHGAGAADVLRSYGASAMLLSPAAGRWRCTQLPPPRAPPAAPTPFAFARASPTPSLGSPAPQ